MTPSPSLSVLGASGFVGSHFCAAYPYETMPESRSSIAPTCDDVLYLISTTDNYSILRGDLDLDIDTNLKHFVRVLPNVRGTFNAVSTWFCYGSAAGTTPDNPAREDSPCDPNGFYSITALAREKLLRSYCQTFNKSFRIIRLCNVIGNDPRASKTKAALEMMLAKVVRGEDIDLYTGSCYRNVLHVNDICAAIKLVIDKGNLNEVYNVGAPQSVRMFDLIQHAKYITGSSSRINLVAPPRFHQVVQVDSFFMDTTKLRGLGFVPQMDAYQAVERVIAGMQ